MRTLFERQLATYASYHRDVRNRATHFVGIPAIVLALLVLAALWRLQAFGIAFSAAWVLALIAAAGWIALDRSIGLAMLAALLPLLVMAEWIASFGTVTAWWAFALLFVGGWIFQLLGHAAFEGRRPALVDNLFQAFVGPMFIMAELLMALGLRRDLARLVEDPSGRN